RSQVTSMNESSLPAGLGSTFYRSSWYARRAFVHQSLSATAVTRHCNGTPLSAAEQADADGGGGYVRVDGTSFVTVPATGGTRIDWNGDLNENNDAGTSQDVTF